MDKTSLGDRMKRYELASKNYLTRRIPAIIRLDGKAFHTFTRGLKKPFDENLSLCMGEAIKELMISIQGCKLAYSQSDEITLVLTDYDSIQTDPWFDYNVQKMVSVSASICSVYFNKAVKDLLPEKSDRCPVFDSRAFSLPKEEVCNNLIWRQQDATRNSIQSLGRAHFSQKQLHGLNCNQIQDKLMLEKGVNWNDMRTDFKRGFVFYRDPESSSIVQDRNIPIFTQDRLYVEHLVFIGEDK